jgi:hypothetical protein
MMEMQAAIADRNAMLALQQARHAERTADIEADDAARDHRRIRANMRAKYGGAGIATGAGSPLDVLADTAAEQGLDVARIRYEGDMRAYEGELQASGYRDQAVMKRTGATNTRRSGVFEALGYGVQGAGKILTRIA